VITGEKHLLTGKIFCSECKNTFSKQRYMVKAGYKNYYRCRSPWHDSQLCDNKKSIPQDELYDIVFAEIQEVIAKYYSGNVVEFEDFRSGKKKKLEQDRQRMIDVIKKKEIAVENLYIDKVEGTITKEQFAKFSNSFETEIAQHREFVREIEAELDKLSREADGRREQERKMKKFKNVKELSRDVVDEFIDKIYIGKYDEKKKTRKVEIHWRM